MNSIVGITLIVIVILVWGFFYKKRQERKKDENLVLRIKERREERKREEKKEKKFEANRFRLPYNQDYNIDSIVKAEVVTDTNVAGVSHNSKSGKPRQDLISHLNSREILDLISEQENPHDPNAIMITNKDGFDIGYLPKDLAKKISPQTNEYDFFAIVNGVTGWDMPTKGLNIKVLKLSK